MRVRFDQRVLDDPRRFGRDVNAIVDRCDRGQHRWVIDDLDSVLASTWIRESSPWDPLAELAEKTWRAAIDEVSSGPRQRLVFVTIVDDDCAGAPDAVACTIAAKARALLEKPLYVILENAQSDWSFIQAMVRTFARSGLEVAIAEHWLIPDQAGGTGEFAKRASALMDHGIPPWRIAAMMDSDRLVPGPLPAQVAKRVEQLGSLGLTVLTLFKREMENYLPVSLFGGKDAVRTSFLSLSREQQDHYDMKCGFDRDPKSGDAAVPGPQRTLFGRNPWHLKRLVGGFGKHIGDRFAGATPDRAEMAAVCATYSGELERLLDTLEELL